MTDSERELERNGLRPDAALALRDGYATLRAVERLARVVTEDVANGVHLLLGGGSELGPVREELGAMLDRLDAIAAELEQHRKRLGAISGKGWR